MVVRNRRNWKWTAAMALGLAWGGAQPAWAQSADQPPVTAAPGAPTLPETNVVAEPETPQQPQNVPNFDQPRSILDGTIFDNPTVQGYAADSSTVGSIINLPNLWTPGTINTITQDTIRDQQIINLEDALRDVGGALRGSQAQGTDGILRPDAFLLRGLEMTSQNFRKNGFLDPTFTPRDFANVERIDVLKGPASMLYGSAQPGGTVNLVTKQPLAQRYDAGTMQFGSFGLQRYAVDSTGQLMGSENVLYRINAAYQDTDSFRDLGFNERYLVSPVVTWILTDDTSLTFETEFHQDRRRYDSGLVAVGGNPRALPINRYLGDPSDFQKFHDNRAMLTLRSQLTDSWSLYVGGSTLFYDAPIQGTAPSGSIFTSFFPGVFGTTYNGPPDTLIRSQSTGIATGQNHAVIANVAGEFSMGLFEHVVLVGTEQDWNTSTGYYPTSQPGLDPLLPIPNPFAPGPFPAGPTTYSILFNFPILQQNRHSVYAQDLVELLPGLKLIFGGRWDRIDQLYQRSFTTPIPGGSLPFTSTAQTFDQGTYRAGLLLDIVPDELTFYAMRATSFNPPGGGFYGNPVPAGSNILPELGAIWEAGVKSQLLDNLFCTLAGFYITRANVPVTLDPFGFTFTQVGKQRSQGVEFNLVGQFTERWSMIGNYTYTDVLQDDVTGIVDGRVRNVPFNMGNVWSRYDLMQTRDSTIGVALGCVAVGQRLGAYPSTGAAFYLPAYDRWDMGFYGRRGIWTGGVYWENIFNVRYETGSVNQFQIFPGAPMNARVQFGATF